MLLTDLLCRGHLALNELLTDDLLDAAYLVLLTTVDDGDGSTLLTGTTRTTAAVGVVLYIVGQAVVDDMRQIIHIQATGSHIGSHQQLRKVMTELLHGEVALRLTEVAVQTLGIIAVLDQLVGNLLRLNLRPAEDNGEDARIEVNNALQSQILIPGVHHVIHMVHILGTLVPTAHHNLLMVVQVVQRYLLDLLAHGSREEQGITLCRHMLKYLVDAVREAHVQHLVSLIKHHALDMLYLGLTAVHKVDQSTGCSHNDLCPMLQGTNLLFNARATINRHHVHPFHVFGEIPQIIGNLQTQFSCRTQNQCLCFLVLHINLLQQRNTECRCLSRTRLGKGNHIVSFP